MEKPLKELKDEFYRRAMEVAVVRLMGHMSRLEDKHKKPFQESFPEIHTEIMNHLEKPNSSKKLKKLTQIHQQLEKL
jgi:hypothetical protein